MMRAWILCSAVAILAGGAVSCKDQQVCEQGRLKMERTWQNVKNTAGKRKIPPGNAELTASEKAQRLTQWQPIEDQAETLRSSFETRQITWGAAEKAHSTIHARFKEIPATGDSLHHGFGTQLQMASAEYSRLREQCQ